MYYNFDIEIAKKYGVEEAIMINNFAFWISHNKANNKNIKDGHCWTFNSIEAFSKLFPFWTQKQIYRILKSLIDKEVLIKANYNDSKYNHTTWYAFKDESIFLSSDFDFTKWENQDFTKKENQTYIKTTDNKTQIENTDYILVAETIKGIVESKSSKQINTRVLNSWIDEIRKLDQVDKVPIEKIVSVAKWYATHFNDNKYIPVVESGKSFREKFVKLEQAIARQQPIQSEKTAKEKFDEISWIFEEEAEKNGGVLPPESVELLKQMVERR